MGFNEISIVIFILLGVFIFTPANKVFKFFNHRANNLKNNAHGETSLSIDDEVWAVGTAIIPNGHSKHSEHPVENGKANIKKFTERNKEVIDSITMPVAAL